MCIRDSSNSIFTITGTGVLNSDSEIASIDNLPAGVYTFLVEDANGNTTFASVNIVDPDEITGTTNPTICFGDSIEIGNTFYNSTGLINEVLTASNGCDSIVTGMLTVLPDPSITIDTLLCFGESVVIGNSTYSENGTYLDLSLIHI